MLHCYWNVHIASKLLTCIRKSTNFTSLIKNRWTNPVFLVAWQQAERQDDYNHENRDRTVERQFYVQSVLSTQHLLNNMDFHLTVKIACSSAIRHPEHIGNAAV